MLGGGEVVMAELEVVMDTGVGELATGQEAVERLQRSDKGTGCPGVRRQARKPTVFRTMKGQRPRWNHGPHCNMALFGGPVRTHVASARGSSIPLQRACHQRVA